MSKLSVGIDTVLHNMVAFMGLSQANADTLHKDIDAIGPALVTGALEGNAAPVATATVQTVVDATSILEARLVQYFENRIAGVPASTAMQNAPSVAAGIDPSLSSAAPTPEQLAAGPISTAPITETPSVPAPVAATVAQPVAEIVVAPPAPVSDQTPASQAAGVEQLAQVGTGSAVASAPVSAPAAVAEDPSLASATDEDFRSLGFKFNPNTGAAL